MAGKPQLDQLHAMKIQKTFEKATVMEMSFDLGIFPFRQPKRHVLEVVTFQPSHLRQDAFKAHIVSLDLNDLR